MQAFAIKAVKSWVKSRDLITTLTGICSTAALQPIKLQDFREIVSTDEPFFLYLQNFDTAVADLVSMS
jgi:hypothetical protein